MTQEQVSVILNKCWPGWTITRALGAGSYGQVFEIQKRDFDDIFTSALKVICIPNDSNDFGAGSRQLTGVDKSVFYEGVAQRLMKEYSIMAKFKGTSNIVSYEEHVRVKSEDGNGWVILIRMECLASFIDFMCQNGLSRQTLIKMGIDICSALELCKEEEVIHRDIKPENIFVSKFGSFKLGDFGVARQMEAARMGMSKQGTYLYMAPEVYRGEKNYDLTVDLYSLGLVMYQHMNNNRLPFMDGELTYELQEESVDRRMGGEPIPYPARDNTPFAQVVCKACAYRPEDRYRTPTEMKNDLMALADPSDTTMFFLPEAPAEAAPVQSFQQPQQTGTSGRIDFGGTVYIDDYQNAAMQQSAPVAAPVAEPAVAPVMESAVEQAAAQPAAEPAPAGKKASKSIIKEPKKAEASASFAIPGMENAEIPAKEKKAAPKKEKKKEAAVKEKKEVPAKEKKPSAGSAEAAGSSKTKAKSGKKVLVAAFIIIGAVAVIILIATMVGRSQRRRVPTTRLPEAEATPAVDELVAEEASEAPVVIEWSDWEESIPSDITAEEYIIEKKLQYRSSALQVFDSADAAPEGYEFLRMSYGEWSEWSAPQSKAVEESDTVNVEKTSATTYQYRVYSTKTVQVEGLNATTVVSSWSNWTNCSYNDYVRYSKMGDSYQVGKNTKNTYKYRTRVAEYYYVDPSSATAYSDLVICPADDKLVSTRTLYRWTPRLEAGTPSMDNVPKIVTDYTGRFTDVDDSQWYGAQSSNFLAVVSELGIMSADEYRFFYPEDSATLGDIVKASVVLYRLINGEEGILVESETSPNMVYFDYAADHSLINPGYFTDLDIPATRAQAAYILSSVLDMVDHMSGIDAAANTIDLIDDVEETHIFYDEINRFVEAGIVSWAEPAGSFRPDDPLTRAQLAVMISHIAYPATRSSNMTE